MYKIFISIYLTYFAYSLQLAKTKVWVFSPPPIPKKNADREEDSARAMTGADYDLMLHCTIGHMHRVDGSERPQPPFEDGVYRQHRYVFLLILHIV